MSTGRSAVPIHRVDLRAADILSDILGEMTPAQHGVYWMISLLVLKRGGSIPDDIEWLRGKFKPGPGLRVLKGIVDHLVATGRIARAQGELTVSWCSDQLELSASRMRAASENGARGGRPKNKNKGVGKAEGFSLRKLPTPTPTPSVGVGVGDHDADFAHALGLEGEQLRRRIGPSFRIFKEVQVIAIDGPTLQLSTPTKFTCNHIREHYANDIVSVWRSQHPRVERVEISVRR